MNRNVLIGLIVGVLALGGGLFLVLGNSDDDNASTTQTNESGDVSDLDSGAVPNITGALTYPLTMTGVIVDELNPENNGTLTVKYEAANKYSIAIDGDGSTFETIYDGDTSYFYDMGTDAWFAIPVGQSTTADASSYGVDTSDFEEYDANGEYLGLQSCSAGQCHTWNWTAPDGSGETSTIRLDSAGRLVELVGTSGTTTSTFTYDYDTPVIITIPDGAVPFEIPDIPG